MKVSPLGILCFDHFWASWCSLFTFSPKSRAYSQFETHTHTENKLIWINRYIRHLG